MTRPVLLAAALAAIGLSAPAAIVHAEQQQEAKTLKKSDREFVDKAAMGGLLEVNLGKVAVQRAQNPEVKQFAQRMIDDHTAANNKLTEIARSKGITLPQALDKKHQEKIDRLSKKAGAEFDRDYMKEMVDDHKEDVAEFERAARDAKDPEIKSFAATTLPTLQEHYAQAKQIREKLTTAK